MADVSGSSTPKELSGSSDGASSNGSNIVAAWDESLSATAQGRTKGGTKGGGTKGATKNDGANVLPQVTVIDRPPVSDIYPNPLRNKMPEGYRYMDSRLTYAEINNYKKMPGAEFVDKLTQEGRLKIEGSGAEKIKASIIRLSEKSPLFRQALLTGLAVDGKYNIVAANYDEIQDIMREKGTSLENMGKSKDQDYKWEAFASLDGGADSQSNKGIGLVFEMSKLYNNDEGLDRVVAHEFGHATLDLLDGHEKGEQVENNEENYGKAGPNQVFTQDVMLEMGYSDDKSEIPTYSYGENVYGMNAYVEFWESFANIFMQRDYWLPRKSNDLYKVTSEYPDYEVLDAYKVDNYYENDPYYDENFSLYDPRTNKHISLGWGNIKQYEPNNNDTYINHDTKQIYYIVKRKDSGPLLSSSV